MRGKNFLPTSDKNYLTQPPSAVRRPIMWFFCSACMDIRRRRFWSKSVGQKPTGCRSQMSLTVNTTPNAGGPPPPRFWISSPPECLLRFLLRIRARRTAGNIWQ